MMAHFEIKDITAETIIGTKNYERLLPTKLNINITVYFTLPVASDDLSSAICYESLYEHICDWAPKQTFKLMESFIYALATSIKDSFALDNFILEISKKGAIKQKNPINFVYHYTKNN